MPEDNPARKSLKLVLGAAGCAFVTPLTNKDKREYGHRCDQQDGEHEGPNQRRKRSLALRDGLSSALLPPPASGERRHRGRAHRLIEPYPRQGLRNLVSESVSFSPHGRGLQQPAVILDGSRHRRRSCARRARKMSRPSRPADRAAMLRSLRRRAVRARSYIGRRSRQPSDMAASGIRETGR